MKLKAWWAPQQLRTRKGCSRLEGPLPGVGKTTLVSLVPRFFDPVAGKIFVDGKDVRHVALNSLRAAIGMILQETYLFNSTIRENLCYAWPDATFEEVQAAARRAHADAFIRELPHGYETIVGERGVKPSGDQKAAAFNSSCLPP
jgi:ABC-type multidrug transport system fused ATPase/permease subunit